MDCTGNPSRHPGLFPYLSVINFKYTVENPRYVTADGGEIDWDGYKI